MNLVTMRTRFSEHVSDLSNDLDDTAIDAYLNRAYQYVIPADVGGEFNESLWELTTMIGTDTYAYAASVVGSLGKSPWIDSYNDSVPTLTSASRTFLDVESDRSVFEYSDRHEDASSGRPNTILFYGREVLVSPVPDLAYIIKIPVRGGPVNVLSNTGIENDIHALAAVTAAATEFLAESEDFAGVQRESALYDGYKQRLHVYAQTRPNERRWKRSF